jgi:hypothetical protein
MGEKIEKEQLVWIVFSMRCWEEHREKIGIVASTHHPSQRDTSAVGKEDMW